MYTQTNNHISYYELHNNCRNLKYFVTPSECNLLLKTQTLFKTCYNCYAIRSSIYHYCSGQAYSPS